MHVHVHVAYESYLNMYDFTQSAILLEGAIYVRRWYGVVVSFYLSVSIRWGWESWDWRSWDLMFADNLICLTTNVEDLNVLTLINVVQEFCIAPAVQWCQRGIVCIPSCKKCTLPYFRTRVWACNKWQTVSLEYIQLRVAKEHLAALLKRATWG